MISDAALISDAVLAKAVAQGLVTDGQASALRSLARDEAALGPEPRRPVFEEERFRFVSGFADIFVTLGIVLFLGAGGYLVGLRAGALAAATAAAVASWGLAEVFSRKRRMALPSIVLLLCFALSCFAALGELVESYGGGQARPTLGWLATWLQFGPANPVGQAMAALGTTALVGLHYGRFKVPITVAAGVAALLLAGLMALAATAPAFTAAAINLLLLGAGLIAFALAMRFDLRDPGRETRRTDIAFWLHLLAAPLIVHSVFQAIGAARGAISPGAAGLVLLIFAGLGLVAILVDRRALLVSGLIYAGVAFSSLIRQVGISDLTVPVTILVLGAFVLVLSAGWAPLRRLILDGLPAEFARRLPRPVLS